MTEWGCGWGGMRWDGMGWDGVIEWGEGRELERELYFYEEVMYELDGY